MGRKIVILTMIAVLFAGTIIPTRTYAIWGVVGSVVVKQTVKHAAKSTMVRAGVRATSKSALERANQAWFSRFTAEQAAAFEAAAARAVPANTPGWLKLTIGASMFLTGVDLAITIWDLVRGGEEVIYPVEPGTEGSRTVVSTLGLVPYISPGDYEIVSPGGYKYPPGTWGYARVYGPGGFLPVPANFQTRVTKEYLNTDLAGARTYGTKVTNFQVMNLNPHLQVSIQYKDHILPKFGSVGAILDSEAIGLIRPEQYTFVSDSLTGVMYVPAPQPAYVPNPHPDLFPNDTQAVEILFPDPSYWPDPDQAVWDNMDYIRNEVPEPITQPYPGAPGEWTDMTPPSASDWASRLHGVVSTRFPFSLPWDLYRVLSLFAAEPERPHIRIDENYMGMPFRFEVDFSFLDPYMPFFRGVIVVGFCVGLILITRKIMGGGT